MGRSSEARRSTHVPSANAVPAAHCVPGGHVQGGNDVGTEVKNLRGTSWGQQVMSLVFKWPVVREGHGGRRGGVGESLPMCR